MALTLTKWIIGLLVLSLFFTGIGQFFAGVTSEYGITETENFTKLHESLNSTYVQPGLTSAGGNATESISSWTERDGDISWYSWGDWMIRSFSTTFSAAIGSISVAGAMVTAVGEQEHIPTWLTGGMIAIIMITISLLIAGILLNRGKM